MKRKPLPITGTTGPSAVAPWKRDENCDQMIARIRRENRAWEKKCWDLCAAWGVKDSQFNNWQHRVFEKGARRVEWWPSTRRLVIDKKFDAATEAGDWSQVFDVLVATFKPSGGAPC